MQYFKNFMADVVVRVDGEKRYIKSIFDHKEVEDSNPDSNASFGGEGYGVFYVLEPITKEQYDTFGEKWTFGISGEIKYF